MHMVHPQNRLHSDLRRAFLFGIVRIGSLWLPFQGPPPEHVLRKIFGFSVRAYPTNANATILTFASSRFQGCLHRFNDQLSRFPVPAFRRHGHTTIWTLLQWRAVRNPTAKCTCYGTCALTTAAVSNDLWLQLCQCLTEAAGPTCHLCHRGRYT